MKTLRILFLLAVLSWTARAATSYTEWYCDNSTGANTNAGNTATASTFSVVSGNWTNMTCKFYKSGLDLSLVTTSHWAAVYQDSATVAAYVAQVTGIDDANDVITLSTAAKSGTSPSDLVGNASITFDGPWKGPNGASGFPVTFAAGTLTNASGDTPCVNMKATSDYQISAVMLRTGIAGPIKFQGYTNTVHDGGRATITDPTAEASFIILSSDGANVDWEDLIFSSNFNSGTSTGVNVSQAENNFRRCVFHDFRGGGLSMGAAGCVEECEAYNCNKNNALTQAGLVAASAGVVFVRCNSHHNTTTGGSGFLASAQATFVNCIAYANQRDGFLVSWTSSGALIGCSSYTNTGSGLNLTGASGSSSIYAENCNFIRNGAYGVNNTAGYGRNGLLVNCRFGAGSMVNGSGDTAGLSGISIVDCSRYADDAIPWVDPDNGDFRINLAAAKGAGRGLFLQTALGYSGTIAYPDIGAAQHQESATAATARAFPFAQ